jgi:hypothetical protein
MQDVICTVLPYVRDHASLSEPKRQQEDGQCMCYFAMVSTDTDIFL